jgi:hypothetical protein
VIGRSQRPHPLSVNARNRHYGHLTCSRRYLRPDGNCGAELLGYLLVSPSG